jgi:hypothetical protein
VLELRQVQRSASDAGDGARAVEDGTAIVTIGTYESRPRITSDTAICLVWTAAMKYSRSLTGGGSESRGG